MTCLLHAPVRRTFPIRAILCLWAAGLLAVTQLAPPERAIPLLVLSIAFAIPLVEPRWAFYALPVTVPFGGLAPLSIGSGATVTASDGVVAGLLVSAAITYATTHGRQGGSQSSGMTLPTQIWTPWVGSLLAIVFVMVISTGAAISIPASGREIAKWVEMLVVVLLARVYVRNLEDVKRIIELVILAGAVEGGLAIYQFLFHVGPANFLIHGRFLRAYGTFGQPNPLAGYLNIVLPLGLAAGWLWRSKLLLTLTGVIALGSAFTFSRAGWVAGCIALIVVFMCLSWRFRPLPLLGLMAVLMLGLLASFSTIPVSPFASVASSFGLTPVSFNHVNPANFSEIERAAHWVAGLRMFEAHPLTGVGIGNYAVAYPAYHVDHFTNALGHAHDYFINVAAETGILGLLAYALFICAVFWVSVRLVLAASSTVARLAAVGVLGAWTSSTFHNLFDVLYVHEIPTLLGLLTAIMCLASRSSPGGHVSDRVPMAIGDRARSPMSFDDFRDEENRRHRGFVG